MRNLLLYISAFIPMYFLIELNVIIDIINQNLEINVLNLILLIGLFLLILLGVVGLIWNIFFNHDEALEIIILEKQNLTDQHFLGYFSLFVLFAVSFDLSKISMFCVFVVVIILIGIVYIKNKLFYINPFLNILGFNFYTITYKVKGEDKEKTAKIFYKGDLMEDKTYFVKLKNEHFSFIDYKKKQG